MANRRYSPPAVTTLVGNTDGENVLDERGGKTGLEDIHINQAADLVIRVLMGKLGMKKFLSSQPEYMVFFCVTNSELLLLIGPLFCLKSFCTLV
ncbi:hypothetical protein [Dictyobacter formicarum]|uniref:hypothetical protein n=1 Tax=Dictyobacter formicarum TaxID=2778368 RepID=UPI0019163088|nr:hypothetical protein [Dictyobacter formicarum]